MCARNGCEIALSTASRIRPTSSASAAQRRVQVHEHHLSVKSPARSPSMGKSRAVGARGSYGMIKPIHIGWRAVALAVIGSSTLIACGTPLGKPMSPPGGPFGSIPAEHGIPSGTGTLSVPHLPACLLPRSSPSRATPNYSIGSVTLFQNFMWRPLYWAPQGYREVFDYPLSIGTKPILSNGDRTVTFGINRRYNWSNGTPVTANDVLFWLDLLKAAVTESPANWGGFTPGRSRTTSLARRR